MANHNAIIRQTRTAVDLVINGAMRKIEQEYADPATDPVCQAACTELLENIKEELNDWQGGTALAGEPATTG